MQADLTGQVDGAQRVFVTPSRYTPGSLVVLLNDDQLLPDAFFETGNRTFQVGGLAERAPPLKGDTLSVRYEPAPDDPA